MPDRIGRFTATEAADESARACLCGGPTRQLWLPAGRLGDTERWFRPGRLLCLRPERHLDDAVSGRG